MSVYNLQQACLAKAEAAYLAAEAHFGIQIPRVPINFSSKMTRCGGRATAKRDFRTGLYVPHSVTLSLPLLKLNGEEFINSTPGHEVAHIIDYHMNGNSDHGRNWTRIMNVIGLQANRCHNMETPKTNKVAAYCGCEKPYYITKQRVTKMRRGADYYCKKCKVSLSLAPGGGDKLYGGRARPQGNPNLLDEVVAAQASTIPATAPAGIPAFPNAPRKPVAKKGSKASYVQATIDTHPELGREAMLSLVRRLNELDGWGIPSGNVRTYVMGNMKKVGR